MVEAGTLEKGDAHVVITNADKREIAVKSKLERIYGDAIRKTVDEMTSHIVGKIYVEDMGALDWVIRARIEAAIRKFRGEEQ